MSEKKQPKPRTQLSRRWNADHLDRISVYVPRGVLPHIRDFAHGNKESVNGLVNRLLQRELGISEEEWKHPEAIKKED